MRGDDRTEAAGPRMRISFDGWRQKAAARATSLRAAIDRVPTSRGVARWASNNRRAVRIVVTLGTGLVMTLVAFVAVSSPALADACSPMTNPVACENTKVGSPPSE